MLTAQDNAAVVRSYYDALNRREMDKCVALVSEDVKWVSVPFNATSTGRKGVREHVENWSRAMPDFKVEIANLFAGDEWTAIEYTGRGTHTGSLAVFQSTIPATQKKVDIKFCELLKIKNGLVVEGHLYFDAATLMRQLGLPSQSPTNAAPSPGQPASITN